MSYTPDELRQVALRAAAAGAGTILSWTASLSTERKGIGDYVTAVDRAAEESVLTVLQAETPDIPVLAEESGGQLAERVWVVDPIDGTTNFLRGFRSGVGVSVGLLQEGRPLVGAVLAPYLGESWSAARGLGAHDGRGRRLVVRGGDGRGVTTTGFPFRRPDNRARYLPVLLRALETFEDLRRPGTASLDCVNVAQGVWDGYFELGLSVWDIAAGALLVTEAGGVVTDWHGDDLQVFTSGDILAGTRAWHERMLELTTMSSTAAADANAS